MQGPERKMLRAPTFQDFPGPVNGLETILLIPSMLTEAAAGVMLGAVRAACNNM